MALTTRAGKGSALSFTELDGNWTELERRTGTGWNDLVQDVIINPGGAAPGVDTIRGGVVGYSFPANTIAECFANFHMRHDYITGTTVHTTNLAYYEGNLNQWIDDLAAIHGLTADLAVTSTTRTAGSISQTLAIADGVTTITRV